MNPDPPEQLGQTTAAEPAAEVPGWVSTPVFGGASLLQIALLCAIGAVWSASVWLIVDRIIDGIGLEKPYSKALRARLTFGPLAGSVIGCMAAFPAALSLAGVQYELDWIMFSSAAACGIVAWAGAKFAHEALGEVLRTALKAILNRIKGFGGTKVPDYTTRAHKAITDEAAAADLKAKEEKP